MDQINDMNCSDGANSCKMLPMASKAAWATAAVMAGATLLGAAAYLAWNSRQAKMLRAAKRTSKILYKAGAILQSVATVAE